MELVAVVAKPSRMMDIRNQVQRYARMAYWVQDPTSHGLVWEAWLWYKQQILECAQSTDRAERTVNRWFYDEWFRIAALRKAEAARTGAVTNLMSGGPHHD